MGSFKRAAKQQIKLRLALIGPSGSGKTFSALRIATALAQPVFVIDTERGSSRHYSDIFEFEVATPTNFAPREYVKLIMEAVAAGAKTIIVDSLSHAWTGKGGALSQVDTIAAKNKGNSYTAWRTVTPQHDELVSAILDCQAHVIVTMRAKTKYVMEQDEKGKTNVKKLGMEAIQRDGLEYEFDVVGDLDLENNLLISKTRCAELNGLMVYQPGEELAKKLLRWLQTGAAAQPNNHQKQDTQENTRPNPASPAKSQAAASESPANTLAEETRALFDMYGVDKQGRAYAFGRIKEQFDCKSLDEIPAATREEYLAFVLEPLRHELIDHGYMPDNEAEKSPESQPDEATSDADTPADPEQEAEKPAERSVGDPDPEVKRLVDNLPKILGAYKPTNLNATVGTALALICDAWKVKDAELVPGDQVENFREYLKSTMIEILRGDGWLPPAADY